MVAFGMAAQPAGHPTHQHTFLANKNTSKQEKGLGLKSKTTNKGDRRTSFLGT